MKLLFFSALAATAPLAVAALLQLLTRRAAIRHILWTVALAATLILPVWLRWRPSAVPTVAALPANVVTAPGTTITVRPEAPIDWLPLAYGLGLSFVLLRHGASLLTLRRLRQGARPVAPGVFASAEVKIPFTYGLGRPAILVPAGPLSSRVLAHEQCHIERGDLWASAVGTLATAVYWFHPLVWWAAAQQRRQAEFAVDDAMVLAGDAAEYAEALVAVARESAISYRAALGAGSDLEPRVRAIIDPARDRRPAGRRAWVALALLVAAPLLLLAQAPVLSGTVFNAAYAEIKLMQGTEERARTSAGGDGEYSFRGLAAGEYSMVVNGRRLFDITLSDSPQTLDVHYREEPAGPGIKVGGNVMSSKLLKKVAPVYPASMKGQRIQGPVQLQVEIDRAGNVASAEVLGSPHPDLTESALTAVRQWVYQPTLLNGNPVAVRTAVRVNYTLMP
jgi:TonB family protein